MILSERVGLDTRKPAGEIVSPFLAIGPPSDLIKVGDVSAGGAGGHHPGTPGAARRSGGAVAAAAAATTRSPPSPTSNAGRQLENRPHGRALLGRRDRRTRGGLAPAPVGGRAPVAAQHAGGRFPGGGRLAGERGPKPDGGDGQGGGGAAGGSAASCAPSRGPTRSGAPPRARSIPPQTRCAAPPHRVPLDTSLLCSTKHPWNARWTT